MGRRPRTYRTCHEQLLLPCSQALQQAVENSDENNHHEGKSVAARIAGDPCPEQHKICRTGRRTDR